MSYKSILVSVNIDGPISPAVTVALDIARRHRARLIGLCAADVALPLTGPEGTTEAIDIWQQMRDEIETRKFKQVHAAFKQFVAGYDNIEWRESLALPTSVIVEAARSSDLIIMAAPGEQSTGGSYRRADPAGVVLRSGRPLLMLDGKTDRLKPEKIVVAWKDTREARRAVSDAVPLLKDAAEVIVVNVSAEVDQRVRESLSDVVGFLSAHGVNSKSEFIEDPHEYLALLRFIDESNADLVVSGAYGHSRLREWAFGGITRSLLSENRINRLLSN